MWKGLKYLCEAKEIISTLLHIARSEAAHGVVPLSKLLEEVLVEERRVLIAIDMRVISKEGRRTISSAWFITYVGARLQLRSHV